MRTLDDLIKHLKQYKDALIIVGNGINPVKYNYTVDDYNSIYNKKNSARNPMKIMKFFIDYLYSEENKSCYNLIKLIDHNLILDQNINGPRDILHLHGNVGLFKCRKCKEVYSAEDLNINKDILNIENCKICNGAIIPTVLLANERYDVALLDKFEKALAKTHTLILIGVDYTEHLILDCLDRYNTNKMLFNAQHAEEKKMTVIIQDKKEEFDPNSISFNEFIVKDNIEAALMRLIQKY